MARIKRKPLNMAIQAKLIAAKFPLSGLSYNFKTLRWIYELTPSILSESYKVKLIYTLGEHPKVLVIDKKLQLAEGKTRLPHVYSTEKQHLCLYYKKANEWRSTMFIVDTIIPWTSEWLFFYEIWLSTGKWKGGGIHSGVYEKDAVASAK